MPELVRLERRDAVGVIRLERPPVNALNSQVVRELAEACAAVDADPAIRAVVVWGGEKAFSAGADLKEMAQGSGVEVMRRVRALGDAVARLESLGTVTIAAISGYALGGGCEIALGCDFRFAARGARIGQPEIAVGLIPGAGGTQRLPRLIGPARAKRMIFTGEFADADTALAWGLVDEVTEPDALFDRALEAAARYAAGPTVSLAAAKRAINRGVDAALAAGLEIEIEAFASLFQTRDTRHGLESFGAQGPGKAVFEGA